MEEMTETEKGSLGSRTDAKLDAHHERILARMDYQLKKMEACLEKTEVADLETNPEEIESEEEHEEVPKEGATVETF
jgi:hypothetical protein